MEIKDFGRVGVLMGGPSSERQISLKSGKAVFSALIDSGLDAVSIDIVTDNEEENIRLLNDRKLDCAFIALHGRFGEDGTIQNILETIRLPYTASGVNSSRLAMDKIGSLEVFKQGGLVVPNSQFLEKSDYLRTNNFNNRLAFPLVVKPANHGSSIGLSLVEREEEMPVAIDLAFEFDQNIIIEEYIYGRELTVGVLGEEALPVIEIIPKNKFFDFEAKYQPGGTEYIAPAVLDEKIAKKVQDVALKAHKLLGCSGCSRTDIILNRDGLPYILEVNTIPGMTATSLLPKAAKIVGIDFNHLCLKLLELAYAKKKL
ncbi:MAG: D-alanine--D-alanine ligase [Candidatus Omnitrophota bacterium]